MRLISLEANQSSFRTVEFKESGLNLIVARQKKPGENERGKTYNGVGKSLLISIIHFCLGADKRHYESFIAKLPNWIFILKISSGEDIYIAERGTENPAEISLNSKPMSIKKFNNILEELFFEIPEDIGFLSFRSLIPFFIRPNKASYIFFDEPSKSGTEYQKKLNNSFLLGLDSSLANTKRRFKKEKDKIDELTDNFKKDNLLREFFTGDKDETLALDDLTEKIKHLNEDLSNFEVAENYNGIKLQANKIERQLLELQNKLVLIDNQIASINKSVKISPDLNKDTIEKIYEESNLLFPQKMTKTLTQLELFYKQLTENRVNKLTDQKNILVQERETANSERNELGMQFDKLLKYLGSHQALDVFVKINNKLSDLKNERDSLQKYSKLIEEYDNKQLTIDVDLIALTKQTNEYLKTIQERINEIGGYFRVSAKKFYPNARAGITIKNNDGVNQIRYDIDAKIEADSSDGINNVKIFCYDQTILFKGFSHSINFLFHDSRLYDGIDERQKTDLFKMVDSLFTDTPYQYIATVNQNQLEEIEKHTTEEEYKRIIIDNTILTLTDDSAKEKLLGIQADI